MLKTEFKMGFEALIAVGLAINFAGVCHADESKTEEGQALLRAVEDVVRNDDQITNRTEGLQLVHDLADKLKAIDPCDRDYNRQNRLVSMVEDDSRMVLLHRWWHRFPKAAWNIRFAALAWHKAYLKRYNEAAPEDKRTPLQKKNNIVHGFNLDYHKWEWNERQTMKIFHYAIKCAYDDIETDRCDYTDEFRAWCRSGIEKAIGRPLTDNDFLFSKSTYYRRREERKQHAVRKPHDGGDVLPHPFTFFGCTFGKAYSQAKTSGKSKSGDTILSWDVGFPIEQPYFGKEWMTASVAPRSKIAFSGKIYWHRVNTRKELLALAKDVKADIEKRLGVKLGDFFFESGQHICDEATWWKADGVAALSRSVFGPIRIEIEAIDDSLRISPGGRLLKLAITDTETESLVEKERKETPLKYDREAEMRQHKERYQRYKAREQEKNKPATQQPTTR